nr:solute carrier family 38 member 9 [Dugesia ryukyuensis]
MSEMVSNERSALLAGTKTKNYGSDNVMIESDDIRYSSQSTRLPISFSSLDDNYSAYSANPDNVSDSEISVNWSASLSRYRYYLRLGVPVIPDHVLPSRFFVLLPSQTTPPGTQSSFITIFSIWNTMMGTSLLSMPWAIQQSGFALGIFLMILVAGLAFYTAYLVLKSTENLPLEPGRTAFTSDFSDACKFYLGRPGEIVSIIFSFLALLSGLAVYYVLLCNVLYCAVNYLNGLISLNSITASLTSIILNSNIIVSRNNNNNTFGALCPSAPLIPMKNSSLVDNLLLQDFLKSESSLVHMRKSVFDKLWNQTHTVPFWLLIVVLPLISIKSPTFFTKFNALGTISVVYLFLLVIIKAVIWGIHIDFYFLTSLSYIPNARVTFIVLTGVGSLAFFIHNAIHSIVRSQAKPENNTRDLLIAYVCVAATYLGIGVIFYVTFPLSKDCIQDNLLNNLSQNDLLAFIGRIFLFFQILTVFPLLMYILRSQFMYFFFKKFYPSWLHVLILHIALLLICVLFSIFLPHIGEIARFSGSICGLVYMITLPALVKIRRMQKEGKLTVWSFILHIGLIVIGLLNFLGQFVYYFTNH